MTDLYQTYRNDSNVGGNKNVISADLENVGQGHIYKNHISAMIGLILTIAKR